MGLYLKQLKSGRDFGMDDHFATQMANFVYIIGDDKKRECVLVDPAWDIPGILRYIEEQDLMIVGVLVTHYHPDHIGGEIFGREIAGLADLLSVIQVPIHVNIHEAEGVIKVAGLSSTDIIRHKGGAIIEIGEIKITLLHTPGHTPGSQCFLIDSGLISGDTLFVGGCGRVDLPGGDAVKMYETLTQVLAKLPDNIRLYPGHDYGPKAVSTMGEEKRDNHCMRIARLSDWLHFMS